MTPPAKRPAILACLGVAASVGVGLAFMSASASYRHGPCAVTKAGGLCVAVTGETLGTVGDSVTGRAESASYRVAAGFLHALAFEDDMCWASDPPSTEVLGGGGSSELVWTAEEGGTYEVKLGEKLLSAGACAAGETVRTEVLAADLLADDWCEIQVSVTGASSTTGVTFRLYNDASPPDVRDLAITEVSARVDTDMATPGAGEVTVLVPGQPDATAALGPGGGFTYAPPAGARVAFRTDNLFGRTVERSLDLMGSPARKSGLSLQGRTIFWTGPGSLVEAEVDISVASQDPKGKLAGSGILRLPVGTAAAIDLATLKGKLSPKAGKKGHKLKLALKSAKGAEPKTKVSVKGYWVDGVVENASVKVSVKKVMKGKYRALSFRALEDGGNPIRVSAVKVAGVVEDARPGSRVEVQSGDGSFAGASPVAFTETLTGGSSLSSTLVADDDATPPNRNERALVAVVSWASEE